MKIALGSAQFGMKYGVANKSNPVSVDEVQSILDLAWKSNINVIDTAAVYGKSEKILGNIGVNKWKIISKIPSLKNKKGNLRSIILDHVNNSLNALGVEKLNGLLLHNPLDLFKEEGSSITSTLNELKEIGIIENIGFSIYSPDLLPKLLNKLHPDIVQAPFNILDQRLLTSGWLKELNSQEIQVHARSIFLQGLLLMEPCDRPSYFDSWKSVLNNWDNFILKNNFSRVEACLGFVSQHSDVSNIILGIDNIHHLKELLKISNSLIDINVKNLSSEDVLLLDPRNWSI